MERDASADHTGLSGRAIVCWGLGCLLALGLVVPAALAVGGVSRAREVVLEAAAEPVYRIPGLLEGLGGPERAARALALYVRVPERLAPERVTAVRMLGHCGAPAARTLAGLIKDGNPEVREAAIYSLLLLGESAAGALPELLAALREREGDEEVRVGAAAILANIGAGAPEVIEGLRAACEDPDEAVRLAALGTLADLRGGREKILAEILHALSDEGSWRPTWDALATEEHWPGCREVAAALIFTPIVPPEPEWRRELRRKLRKRISFEFEATDVEEALNYLGYLAEVDIAFDPALGSPSADYRPVTLRMKSFDVALAMAWVTRLASLDYELREDGVFVATPDRLKLLAQACR